MFLLERDRILKKWYVTVSETQFPTKCPFQPPRPKTVGGDTFLVAKSILFRRGENTSKYNKMQLCAKYQCKQQYKLLICSVDIIALIK